MAVKYMKFDVFTETDGLYVLDIFCTILINASLRQDGISTAPGVVRRAFKLEPPRITEK